MSDFENLQRIIRLKKYESPNDDFLEDFVARFRERQRSELLRQSARGLLWERCVTFWENLVSPKWTMAAVTASVLVICSWGLWITAGGTSSLMPASMIASADPLPSALSSQPQLAVQSELIRELDHSADELEIEGVLLLSRHFEGDEIVNPTITDNIAKISGDALPISYQLEPRSTNVIR
jgi:hypothetical protein